MRLGLAAVCTILMLVIASFAAVAQDEGPRAAPTAHITVNALPAPISPQAGFNARKATDAYLARVNGAARSRSDSYFEGGYVLLFVDTIYAVAVSALLLWLGISAILRDFVQKLTPIRFLQAPLYAIVFFVLSSALTFPLTVYEQFVREHAYSLSNQTFMQWLGDFTTGLAINLAAFAIVSALVYTAIRATPRYWWVWGTCIGILFFAFSAAIQPVFIEPLFNHYESLRPGPLKAEILSLARAEGVPATDVYEFDASRQSSRISANVSGLFGTTRISLTDNLLKRCTPDEIVAVLGHEMGHYVLDHIALGITWMGLLFLAGFAFVNWGFRLLAGLFGAAWGVRGIEDPAGLPVLMALLSVFSLLATPVMNTMSRTIETQADIFGINAVRKPDAFAEVTLMLSEYRKLDPGPLEEFLFYDHPSGRDRISMAMRWKAEHLNDIDIKDGPVSPR